ncbi:vacuolar amino acid permease [Auriculariales sp. MPI-PUGE-AT-0066]|nr:vacuolar amino acid permease [Auriculariales sp. MPI-PUGE-AT-0066]
MTTAAHPLLAPSQDDQPRVSLSKRDLAWVLFALWSAVFLGALDGTVVATIIPPIGAYFNKSHQASYLGTSYLLSICCVSGVYGVGTAACGFAPSMEALIAFRALAGLGGGGITVTDLIPLKRRGLYQGLANILFGFGAGIGGPLGGWLNDVWGWRSAFIVQIPIIILSGVLISLKVDIPLPPAVAAQSTREKLARIDYLGALTLMSTVATLLLGVSLKTDEDLPWSSPVVIGLLITAALSAVAFVFVESKVAKEPILPMSLLTERTPAAVGSTNLCVSVGLHLLPNSIALSIGSVYAGWHMRRTGKYWNLSVVSASLTLAASILLACWSKETHPIHLWLDIVPSGLGASALITSTLIALISSVDRSLIAVATGLSYLFRTTGQVLGVALSGALIQGVLMRKLQESITGPDAADIIQRVRHSTDEILKLDPVNRDAAIGAYGAALRAAFIAQAVVGFLALVSCLPIEEFPLPGTHEEQEEHDRKRREATLAGNGNGSTRNGDAENRTTSNGTTT